MALIQQISTVYVDFQQPAAEAQRLRVAMAEGKLQGTSGKNAPVSLTLEGTSVQRQGKLLFSDISVDRATGQLSLRGEFDNRDGLLLPGMYVRVSVAKGTASDAILLPQRAVHLDAQGVSSLWVVNQDNVVEQRVVRTGQMYGVQWHVLDGVRAAERVIVGGPAVTAGQKVSIAGPSDKQ